MIHDPEHEIYYINNLKIEFLLIAINTIFSLFFENEFINTKTPILESL